MARIAILDPTAAPPQVDPDPGPDLGALAGRRVGFRYDLTWRSFHGVIEEWSHALRAMGVHTQAWCAGDGNRAGDVRARVQAGLEAFADSADAVVVGLGN